MKTINRNNYEEYFLLYADNELDAETKIAVENFIEQNTDLAIELDMLIRTKSSPEEIVFTDKEILLRTEGVNINEYNYEEYFLLYIDNELSTAKREEVEMYVLQHPQLQKKFTDLKRAVLVPEAISYADKKGLYRREKKRTIYLKPWRLAAAAIFTGVCAVGFWLIQKPVQINPVAVNHSAEIKAKQNPVVKPADTIQQKITITQETVAQQTLPSTQNKIAREKAIEKNKIAPEKNKEADVAEQHPLIQQENTSHKNVEPGNIIKQSNEPESGDNNVAIETVPSNQKEPISTEPIQVNDNSDANNNSYKVYDVAYKEINANDDDNSLHVGAFDLNKNKVKNLFKKAGRVFSNKQDNLSNDDGKLQVANFEIQTNKQ